MTLAGSLTLTAGCQRTIDQQYVSSPAVAALEPQLEKLVQAELRKRSGTPQEPKLIGATPEETAQLKHGADVYRRNCEQCHGVTGDGNGPAGQYLTPRPRDYRRGIFKFTSTPYGSKPRREDLMRTIERGVTGTSMPSFRLMPKNDREAVLDYVLALTHRGELEELLVAQAESEGELPEEMVNELVSTLQERWGMAAESEVDAASKMPPITEETVAAGAQIFQQRECFKCHGRDGRGGLAGGIEVGNDAWGHKDPAADLTSGMLHGGQRPIDIYRRISSGINGTPMPSFRDSFASDPDAIWHLTHYVLSVSNERRRGVQFPTGAAAASGQHAAANEAQSEPDQPDPVPAEDAAQ
jgi:mono/diheme cytochrome c family protein